jgi:chromosome segregation ATPase
MSVIPLHSLTDSELIRLADNSDVSELTRELASRLFNAPSTEALEALSDELHDMRQERDDAQGRLDTCRENLRATEYELDELRTERDSLERRLTLPDGI